MAKYLAGIDVGTTGARCAIFDVCGRVIGGAYREYGADYPKPGWVDQDGLLLISQTMEACQAGISDAGIDPTEIASIGFSTQRSVTGPVDAAGQPVRPMISWQDARTGREVEEMGKLIDADEYYAISGVPMGTTWVITKLLWMRRNEPELYEKTARFTQNQDLVLKAFGADAFHTDISDMAFYGVWDVRNVCWDQRLMDLFDVTPEMFGAPTPSGTQVGTISRSMAEKTGFAPGTPVCVGAGDQNCSVIGMGAIRSGMATVTLGTAGLAILAVDTPVPGFGGMMITNHVLPGMWEVEGLSNAAASSYRWYRDTCGALEVERQANGGGDAYRALDTLAAQAPPGSRGLLFMPYLATAGTPRWNANARAAFLGMSLAHGRPELTRAVMEGVALEIRDMMEGWLQKGMQVDVLRLGGGATHSPLWNQIQADVYGRPVQTLEVGESTVLGAALLGGVGAGVFADVPEGVDAMVHVAGELEPNMDNHRIYEDLYGAYASAYADLSNHTFDALARLQAD